MAYFDVTTFDGVTIVTSVRVQVAMNETGLVVARIGQLENGAIFDADSTTDADTQLGLVTVRYKILPASNGASNLNGQVRPLENLKGKHGTLTGVERATPERAATSSSVTPSTPASSRRSTVASSAACRAAELRGRAIGHQRSETIPVEVASPPAIRGGNATSTRKPSRIGEDLGEPGWRGPSGAVGYEALM